MLIKTFGGALTGIDAITVTIEACTQLGAGLTLVGLPDTAVKESCQRVQAAITNIGMEFPRSAMTVNLAPADVRKEGPAFDLPIALAIPLHSCRRRKAEGAGPRQVFHHG